MNDNGVYDALVDVATHVDERDINESVAIFLVANIPLARVDGGIAAYVLQAQVAEGGGAGVAGAAIATDERLAADTTMGIEDVFADGENANYAGDADRNGIYSSEDICRIGSAVLIVVKTSTVTADSSLRTSWLSII